jgi:hypothetical protein
VIVGHWVILFLVAVSWHDQRGKQKAPAPTLEDEGQLAIVVPPPFAAVG